jgi:hypothetical protein
MSLQSERILAHLGRLRLTHLSQCYEGLAEEAAQKNLPYLDFWRWRARPSMTATSS